VIPVLQGWRGGEVAEGESPRPHRRAREGGESRDGDGCAAAGREPARGAGARDVTATAKHGDGRAANCGGGRDAQGGGTVGDGGVGRSRGARAGSARVWTVEIKGSRSDG